MYSLLWRALPGSPPVKAATTLLLLALACAVLWYVVFPWLEPHVPLDRVTVGG